MRYNNPNFKISKNSVYPNHYTNTYDSNVSHYRFRVCNVQGQGNIQIEDPMISGRNIRCYGNDIYFFDDVDEETQMILQTMLKSCIANYRAEHTEELFNGDSLRDFITIHINSCGGLASSGLALYDFIKGLSTTIPICCSIEGFCASSASLIFLAGSVRTMSDNSSFLIHQVSWGAWGKNQFMKDMMSNADKVMDKIVKIYMEETTIGSDAKTDTEREEIIRQTLTHDLDWYRDDCIKYGVVQEPDEIPELSQESMDKLNAFANKLLQAELKKAKREEENKNKPAPKKKPIKKTAKKPIKKKADTTEKESKEKEEKN